MHHVSKRIFYYDSLHIDCSGRGTSLTAPVEGSTSTILQTLAESNFEKINDGNI